MRAAAALLLLLLNACTTLPVVETPSAAQNAWEAWFLNGRIAVRQGEEGWHGGIVWRAGATAVSSLRVSGPLGRPALDLEYGPGQAVLRTADGRVRHAPDARTLLREATGLDLPLSGLRYWVQGYANPVDESRRTLDANGHLKELHQAGWRIVYGKYQVFQDQLRPTRVELTRADITVKLVLKSWRADTAE